MSETLNIETSQQSIPDKIGRFATYRGLAELKYIEAFEVVMKRK